VLSDALALGGKDIVQGQWLSDALQPVALDVGTLVTRLLLAADDVEPGAYFIKGRALRFTQRRTALLLTRWRYERV
jgi:hypothetical protein